ncbi:hypothetical protein [Bifidobacterium vansinderenii]|uniref:Uncharacterized protein n=1 Tax=Bifidobacterium vansinderenii TaxID=1984871 RepID=A0A229VWA5_9BIFI|nr:hypothetical protein [Bifidobacterium vansinderenii]OXM99900.1 hypothetical protein Tam10B_1863 [Bifidobacterium vansinderenii]
MSRQITKGKPVPPGRIGDVILANEWLAHQLGRPLRAAEAQTFGRMCLEALRRRYGQNLEPYTIRVGEESSQRTAYLHPENQPILMTALNQYRQCKSYKRIEAQIRAEQENQA